MNVDREKIAYYVRVGSRYAIGYIAAKGWVSSMLADTILSDPEIIAAVNMAVTAAAVAGLEYVTKKMRDWGWLT